MGVVPPVVGLNRVMLEKYYWELLAKKLSGEATARELEELEQLGRLYPHLREAEEPIESLWKTPPALSHPDATPAFELLWSRIQSAEQPAELIPHRSSSRRFWYISAAASILLLLIGTIYFVMQPEPAAVARIDVHQQTRQVYCPAGSKTKLLLPDSSTVWLNSGSRITYNDGYGVSNRDLTLTGEAFFDVRKSRMPFIIKTANIQIRVLGTAFNVRAYPHEKRSETSLIRGSVEVTLDERPNERIVLKPSEKIIVKHNQKAAAATVREPLIVLGAVTSLSDSTVAETTWMEHRMIFRSETFAVLAKRLEARYGVKIVFSDEQLKQQRFTGVFTDESVTEVLEALQYSHAFRFTLHDNTIDITP